jgi:hypothetical protein
VKNNYNKIKERKQQQARDYYTAKGKQKYEKGITEVRYKLGRLVQASKQRAKKNSLDHNLSLDYIYNLYIQQNKVCSLTGRQFYVGKCNGSANQNTPTIDRIIPQKDT